MNAPLAAVTAMIMQLIEDVNRPYTEIAVFTSTERFVEPVKFKKSRGL